MNGRPAVSVLITAFNREWYIGPAIESVLAQTFTDFELIIVDDCSTDATAAVAARYLSDPRVRLVKNARNLGQFPNRNYAASLAAGEYLRYHDSDDLMYPHCLSVLVDALSAEPTAAFAISAHRSWTGGPAPMLLTPRMAYEREFFGLGVANFGPGCALFRRDAFAALGGFSDEGPHSDELFWLKACARVNTLLAPGDLFWYRVHADQHLRSPQAAYDGATIQWKWFEALDAPECPLPPRIANGPRGMSPAKSSVPCFSMCAGASGIWRCFAYGTRGCRGATGCGTRAARPHCPTPARHECRTATS